MEERNLSTWEEFKKELTDLRREREQSADSDDSPLLFRGQANACWSLGTTLDRKQDRMRWEDYYQLIRIPAFEGPKVLKELDEYDLNAFSLFGSEESLMETLSARQFSLAGKIPVAAN